MEEIMNIRAYIKDVSRYPRISREEEHALAKKIKKGDEQARETLINANLGLVLYMASKYRGKGVSYEDLVAEGNIGLVLAASRWKTNKKTRFSTYAMFYIRKYIILALSSRNGLIRIPSNLAGSTNSLHNKLKQEENENGPMTKDQIMKKVGKKYNNHPVERILSTMNISYCGLSKVSPNGEIFERADEPLTTSSFEGDVESVDMREKSRAKLRSMLANVKHGKVIEDIYGLSGNDPIAVEKMAESYGMTGQALHGWKKICFQKLRKNKDSKILKEFVDAL
jgi:RNA polymerase primary sigma factor